MTDRDTPTSRDRLTTTAKPRVAAPRVLVMRSQSQDLLHEDRRSRGRLPPRHTSRPHRRPSAPPPSASRSSHRCPGPPGRLRRRSAAAVPPGLCPWRLHRRWQRGYGGRGDCGEQGRGRPVREWRRRTGTGEGLT
jgi:hypothetical protein